MIESANTQQQTQFRILLIGDNCTDVYQYGTIDRLSPEAPVPVFVPTRTETRAGMASNVANNLEALGCDVNYLHGETSVKTRLIDERSKQQIVRIDNDAFTQESLEFVTDIPLVYDAIVISENGCDCLRTWCAQLQMATATANCWKQVVKCWRT